MNPIEPKPMSAKDLAHIRLIRTAPKVLRALKELLHQMEGYEVDEAASKETIAAMKRARRVIAQAEGQP